MKSSAKLRRLLIRMLFLGTSCVLPCLAFSANPKEAANAEATATPSAKPYIPRQSYWNRYVGDLYLSVGFSREFNYNSQLGGKMVLDYMVDEKISIGAQTGYYLLKTDNGNYDSSYLGIRTSYHLIRAKLHKRQNPWNVYTGIAGLVEIGGGEKDWHEKRFFADLHLGTRCRLSPKCFLWGEAALTNVSLGLSFSL